MYVLISCKRASTTWICCIPLFLLQLMTVSTNPYSAWRWMTSSNLFPKSRENVFVSLIQAMEKLWSMRLKMAVTSISFVTSRAMIVLCFKQTKTFPYVNVALMLAFAFAGCRKDTLLIHASLVRKDGVGYPFIAQSGTGKSTHVGLWLQHIPGCDMMNDDNPFVRIIGGKPYIYGGPWSGKTPCYRNVKAPLGAVTRIDRAKQNSIERLHAAEAFTSLLPACSSMKWDKEIYDNICNTVAKIVETTPIYTLHCLPDKEAALLCCQTITKRNAWKQ